MTGLTVTTALRKRELPWHMLRGAFSTSDGVFLRCRGVDDFALPHALTAEGFGRRRRREAQRLARTLDMLIDRMAP